MAWWRLLVRRVGLNVVKIGLASAPLCLGLFFGLSLVNAPHGYAAAYDYAGAALIAGLGLLLSAPLCIWRRTRPFGKLALLATLLFIFGFGGTWGSFELFGRVAWRHSPDRVEIR